MTLVVSTLDTEFELPMEHLVTLGIQTFNFWLFGTAILAISKLLVNSFTTFTVGTFISSSVITFFFFLKSKFLLESIGDEARKWQNFPLILNVEILVSLPHILTDIQLYGEVRNCCVLRIPKFEIQWLNSDQVPNAKAVEQAVNSDDQND